MTHFRLPETFQLVSSNGLHAHLQSLGLAEVTDIQKGLSCKWDGLKFSTVLCCDDRIRSNQAIQLEKIVRSAGKTFVFVQLCGSDVLVGPVSRTGTGCTGCALTRISARRTDPELSGEIENWMNTKIGQTFKGMNKVITVEAIIVAVNSVRLFRFENTIHHFDFGSQTWKQARFLPVWNCTTCVNNKEHTDTSPFSKLGKYAVDKENN